MAVGLAIIFASVWPETTKSLKVIWRSTTEQLLHCSVIFS